MRNAMFTTACLLVASLGSASAQDPYGAECAPQRRSCLGRLCDRLQRCSCGYGKTHHDFGCTGWRGEAIFIFGGCWEFFEEPCRKQPQPPLPWVNRSGYPAPGNMPVMVP